MSQDVQLIMLGSGRGDLEHALRGMEDRHRDKCRSWVGFSVEMAHRITPASTSYSCRRDLNRAD